MCDQCRTRLGLAGHVTLTGGQVRQGMAVGSVRCGPVYVNGVTLPPTVKKWAEVPPLEGRVERRVPGGWQTMEARDLERLDKGEPKVAAALAGFAVSAAYPVVSAKCEYNAFKAVCARVFRPPQFRPTASAWVVAKRFLPDLMPGFCQPSQPIEFAEWVAEMPTRRRKALTDAYVRLNRFGWKGQYEGFSAFVKTEKLCGYSRDGGVLRPVDTLIDRLIQGPHDATHVVAGPFMRPLIARLKAVWGLDSRIFYASRAMSDVQEWLDVRLADGPFTAFAADYSMFDNTHSEHSWAFMEDIYRRCGSEHVRFLGRTLKAWRAPKARITGKGWALRYEAPVMNASGRDDTALANGVLNGVVMYLSATAAFFKVKLEDLTDHQLRTSPVRVAVCGDDSLGFLPRMDPLAAAAFAGRLSRRIARFGFDAAGDKIVMTDNDPAELVFLGQRPYYVSGRWLWGKTLGRALYKFGWKTAPVSIDLAAWFAGECVAITKTQRHVPVLYDLAARYLECRPGGKILHVTPDVYRPWTLAPESDSPYTSETIYALSRLYQVSPEAIFDLIVRIKSMDLSGPCVLQEPVLERMVIVDDP